MLCKLCKSGLFHSCIAQISAVFALAMQAVKSDAFHSLQKMADFCAMQLCKLCTPLKGGLGALHSTYPHPFGFAALSIFTCSLRLGSGHRLIIAGGRIVTQQGIGQ